MYSAPNAQAHSGPQIIMASYQIPPRRLRRTTVRDISRALSQFSIASPSAQNTVFTLPELIEAIFFQLDMADLLVIQRVSKRWQNIITTSPALQQKLFFKPVPKSTRQRRFNPLLKDMLPAFFRTDNIKEVPQGMEQCDIIGEDWYQNEHRRRKFLCKEASWRRMYPIQPPTLLEELILSEWYCCSTGGLWEPHNTSLVPSPRWLHRGSFCSGKIEKWAGKEGDDGIMMGPLFDQVAHEITERYHDQNFLILWHMLPPNEDLTGIQFGILDPKRYPQEPGCPIQPDTGIRNSISLYFWSYDPCGHCSYGDDPHLEKHELEDYLPPFEHAEIEWTRYLFR